MLFLAYLAKFQPQVMSLAQVLPSFAKIGRINPKLKNLKMEHCCPPSRETLQIKLETGQCNNPIKNLLLKQIAVWLKIKGK